MRIIVAACSVDHQGRFSAHLPEAKRLLVGHEAGCARMRSRGLCSRRT
ncbi:MAG: hypothetical protein ACRDZ3_00490 [Acidimicrobiia bacterium]